MTRILAAIASAAFFATAALAAQVEGTVQTVDPATRTVTLDDGKAYVAAEGVDVSALSAGTKVKVTFDDGTMTITEIEAM